jgi:hypothetical protein
MRTRTSILLPRIRRGDPVPLLQMDLGLLTRGTEPVWAREAFGGDRQGVVASEHADVGARGRRS